MITTKLLTHLWYLLAIAFAMFGGGFLYLRNWPMIGITHGLAMGCMMMGWHTLLRIREDHS